MDYYSAIKKDEIMPFAVTWMDLKSVILNEVVRQRRSEVKSLSRVRLFVWTVACQAPLSMGFSRQQYWSGLPFPSPGDLPNPGIEAGSPTF